MKVAFVFPGQGSQFVGMGKELAETYPLARSSFEEADHILGFPLSQLCFQGPEPTLTDTINAQPALLVHSIAALRVLMTYRGDLTPAFVAGHSLGEYSALVAADVLEFGDGVRLVRERGRLMKEAGAKHPGAMASILNLDGESLEQVCRETGAQIANYNNPGNMVITGTRASIDRAAVVAKERGARRVIVLAVSIASHSRLMESAAREFKEFVLQTPMRAPRVPVISNVSALPLTDVTAIKNELVEQLTRSVQWIKSVEYMASQGATQFVELGPKDAVAGMVRRIASGANAASIGDVASMEAFVGE